MEEHDATRLGLAGLILLGVTAWALIIAALRAWVQGIS